MASPQKGFGKKPAPTPKKPPLPSPETLTPSTSSPFQIFQAPEEEPDEEPDDDEVPEVVTNRMLKRLIFTVGLPLFLGVGFFPMFYYLKIIQKVDVPDWLPLICSVSTFGLAGLGISYGVISTSWDPEREGTLLGWKEARANWPVFTQTFTQKKE